MFFRASPRRMHWPASGCGEMASTANGEPGSEIPIKLTAME
jgi:hypothetical protein